MSTPKNHFDIIVIGGGMVGLAIAALTAKHHFSVAIIESKQPTLNWHSDDYTARVSTIHCSSQQLLDYIGAWNSIDTLAKTPLHQMHIWDYAGAQLDFDCTDVDYPEMGFIVENRAIVKSLWQLLENNKNVTFLFPCTPNALTIENNIATLTLDNQTSITADLVIGADGAHSWLREQMPITCNERAYYQKSIIAVIESEKSHQHTAYQQFLETGPVALLPLANEYHTALVWSSDDAISDALMQSSDDDFNKKLSRALDFRLGQLKIISKRAQFPLIMRHTDQYTSPHCALVGDAAHTIHPLAGQGVNLGLMDAACLAQTLIDAKNAHKPLGTQQTLRRYTRWRKADNTLMINAMCAFKTIFSINVPAFNVARSAGSHALNDCHFLKNQIMEIAMGLSKDLPDFLLDHHRE